MDVCHKGETESVRFQVCHFFPSTTKATNRQITGIFFFVFWQTTIDDYAKNSGPGEV